MCLVLPPGRDVHADDRPALIETIGEALRLMGMNDVRPRSTARIPIVQFIDPVTGLECDISFNNPLALCNTKLLRTYSETDPRVRPLVYIIKNWAKNRQINAPGDGTLSSYGYRMLLLHYLQLRPHAVVPNLQRLPPDWEGQHIPPSTPLGTPNSHEIELNPVDSTPCKTYFYSPPSPRHKDMLHNFGASNRETVAELLAGFFAYYAYDFNFRHTVVSIQSGHAISKVSKVSRCFCCSGILLLLVLLLLLACPAPPSPL
jgi:terminal uridylyltransferase